MRSRFASAKKANLRAHHLGPTRNRQHRERQHSSTANRPSDTAPSEILRRQTNSAPASSMCSDSRSRGASAHWAVAPQPCAAATCISATLTWVTRQAAARPATLVNGSAGTNGYRPTNPTPHALPVSSHIFQPSATISTYQPLVPSAGRVSPILFTSYLIASYASCISIKLIIFIKMHLAFRFGPKRSYLPIGTSND